jgi:DnaJ-domain-containing protein 1
MGIWNRLENVIKSYLNDDAPQSGSYGRTNRSHDPDLDAAYEELNDFLRGGASASSDTGREAAGEKREKERPVPGEIREDFTELGLAPGATAEECKAAYKKLLKIHHPDRHADHPGNMKKATEKTARINSAYRRLEKWFIVSGGS